MNSMLITVPAYIIVSVITLFIIKADANNAFFIAWLSAQCTVALVLRYSK